MKDYSVMIDQCRNDRQEWAIRDHKRMKALRECLLFSGGYFMGMIGTIFMLTLWSFGLI